ncbi:hypothetical protein ACHAWX_002882 [Stephanocyclus meneghinianus]
MQADRKLSYVIMLLSPLILASSLLPIPQYNAFQPLVQPTIRSRNVLPQQNLRYANKSNYGLNQHEATNNCTGSKNRLLIFGLGNIGTLLAERAKFAVENNNNNNNNCLDVYTPSHFQHVYGTTSKKKTIDDVEVLNITSCQEWERILTTCTHILVTVPPINSHSNADQDICVGAGPRRLTYCCDSILNHPHLSLRESIPKNTWLGYISTTSVYGNHDGEWVTEHSEEKCQPGSKGELYLRAEEEWRKAARECGWKLHIFRCAGLYGNGRSALHTLIKSGLEHRMEDNEGGAASKKVDYPTSRVHEEDVVRAILHAMFNPFQSEAGQSWIWNLADDDPAPRSEVMVFGSNLLDKAGITLFPSRALTPVDSEKEAYKGQKSQREKRRKLDKKRVCNRGMKTDLLPDGKLIYPTYREGLMSILNNNKDVWMR